MTINSYNALGQSISETLGDGYKRTRNFDTRGRLTAQSILTGDYSWAFGYSGNGNVISANDPFNGNWTNFTYDDFNRISAATCTVTGGVQPCPDSQSNLTLGFTYDQYGNRWTQTASYGGNSNYSFNAYNQITSASGVLYDDAGNMTADGLGNTLTYDGENRVTAISTGGTANVTYAYDAFGHRVETGINTGGGNFAFNDYVFDPSGHMIYKWNNQANNQDEIYAGPLHLGLYDDASGSTYFTYGDQVGSTRIHTYYNGSGWALYEANANGAGCSNDPFGDSESCFGSLVDIDGLYFTDQEQENSYPMYTHFPYREYSSTQGRWIHPDPLGMLAVDPTNPQSLDRYTYVLNNPLSYIDPLGLDYCVDDGGAVIAAEDGGGDSYSCQNAGGSWVQEQDPNQVANSNAPPPPDVQTIDSALLDFISPGTNCVNGLGSGGAGIGAGYNVDLGVAKAGASSTAGFGGALFHNRAGGIGSGYSAGAFASGAATAYAGSHVVGAPTQTSNTVFALGAYAGAGANVSVTNAASSQQLAGPFTTVSINLGVGQANLGVQVSFGKGIWQVSVTPPIASVGIGVSGSVVTTNTAATHTGCS